VSLTADQAFVIILGLVVLLIVIGVGLVWALEIADRSRRATRRARHNLAIVEADRDNWEERAREAERQMRTLAYLEPFTAPQRHATWPLTEPTGTLQRVPTADELHERREAAQRGEDTTWIGGGFDRRDVT